MRLEKWKEIFYLHDTKKQHLSSNFDIIIQNQPNSKSMKNVTKLVSLLLLALFMVSCSQNQLLTKKQYRDLNLVPVNSPDVEFVHSDVTNTHPDEELTIADEVIADEVMSPILPDYTAPESTATDSEVATKPTKKEVRKAVKKATKKIKDLAPENPFDAKEETEVSAAADDSKKPNIDLVTLILWIILIALIFWLLDLILPTAVVSLISLVLVVLLILWLLGVLVI